MSEAPDLSEAEVLAAEHALGVLTAPERAQAELRMARDPDFATAVGDWRRRLSPLSNLIASVSPPAGLWPRIERALPANDDVGGRRRLRFWRGATVSALGLAAASLAVAVMLAGRPPVFIQTQAPAPPPMLNASLMTQGDGARPLFIAAYDPARGALIITSLATPGADPVHVHELWVIPADGKPHSLGMVEPGKSKAMPMPETMANMFAEGSALAVSVEPPGGSPKADGPSGPIAAVGKLSKI